MKNLIINLLQWIFRRMYAKKKFYSLFYFLYLQSLKGMDHGFSYIYPENSGEYDVLQKIALYYRGRKISFFDVGANIGYYATEVSKIFKSNAKIFCFEPSAFTYRTLINNVGNIATSFQFGFSNKVGSSTLHSDKDGSGMASLEDTAFAPPFGISAEQDEVVVVTTLDQFCNEQNILRIEFLKLDVEGHELSVLEGAANLLKKKAIDFIQFEFGRVNIDSGASLKKFYKLLHHDYYLYRIIKGGLIPQFEYSYEYEIYLGTNFLAVNKSLNDDSLDRILQTSF